MRACPTALLCLCLTAAAPASRPSATITVGQPWADALAVARHSGRELHDAGQLAMLPTPVGFYLDLPQGRGLLVLRSADGDTVGRLESIDGVNGPKADRTVHPVKRYDVPPAAAKDEAP